MNKITTSEDEMVYTEMSRMKVRGSIYWSTKSVSTVQRAALFAFNI